MCICIYVISRSGGPYGIYTIKGVLHLCIHLCIYMLHHEVEVHMGFTLSRVFYTYAYTYAYICYITRSIWDLHYQECFTPMHTPMHIYVTSRGRGPYGIYTIKSVLHLCIHLCIYMLHHEVEVHMGFTLKGPKGWRIV